MFACMSTDVCEGGRGDERFFDSFFFFFLRMTVLRHGLIF